MGSGAGSLDRPAVIVAGGGHRRWSAPSILARLTPTEQILVCLFLLLALFPLLVRARSLDTTTLYSWRWVMAPAVWPRLYLFLAGGSLLVLWPCRSWPLERLPSWALFLLATALGMSTAGAPEMLLDSGRYLLQGSYLAAHGPLAYLRQWGAAVWPWTDLPLSGFFYGLVWRLAGEHRWVAQLGNSLLLGVAVVAVCRCGRRLWGRQAGVYGGLLLLAMPLVVVQAGQVTNDLHVLVCLLLVLETSLACLARPGWHHGVLCGAAVFACLLVKYSTWPMLAVLGPVLLVAAPRDRQRPAASCRALATAWASGTALALAGLLAWRPTVMAQLAILATYQRAGLAAWQEGYLPVFLFHGGVLVVLAGLLGLVAAWRRRLRSFLLVAWFPLLALALGMGRSRYLLPFFAFLALAGGYGLARGGLHPWPRRFAGVTALLWGLVVVHLGCLPFARTTAMANLTAAGRYLDRLDRRPVAVLPLPQHRSLGDTAAVLPLLDLATHQRLVLAPPPFPRPVHQGYRSSLEFTGRMPLDRYQPDPALRPAVLLVVGDRLPPPGLLPGLEPLARFQRRVDVFRFTTQVAVYRIHGPLAAVAQTVQAALGPVPNGTVSPVGARGEFSP